MLKMSNKECIHNKTGNKYRVLIEDAIECTNGREDKHYVVYCRDGLFFVREADEFKTKFTIS